MSAERAAASRFSETRNTLQSVCAVNMIQASLFTDTLHVENIHHPNFLQSRSISPLSRLQNKKRKKTTNTQMTEQMVLNGKRQKITYILSPLCLPPAS